MIVFRKLSLFLKKEIIQKSHRMEGRGSEVGERDGDQTHERPYVLWFTPQRAAVTLARN